MIIKLLIEGGDMKPGPAIAQQLGPKGINMGKVIADVNTATKAFKGMKVPVELDVNEKTKTFTVKALSPPTAELLKQEAKLTKGSPKQKEYVANISIEDVIKVASIKHSNMLEKELKSAVRSVLGTCAAMGILVENNTANELSSEIASGKFANEIKNKKTETLSDKRTELSNYLTNILTEQENKKKVAEAAAAAATAAAPVEEKKDAKATTAPSADKSKEAKPKEAKPAAKKK
jgi:large subunit ribosomal protein L11